MSRILVVEDENHLAEGLRFNLEAEHYDVELAESGEQALALLSETPRRFDAVVLDVMLPGIDGFEVAGCLRRLGNFIPVLMLTARGRPGDVLLGFAAGADDYLAKPFDLAILLARIQGLLRRAAWAGHAPAPPVDTYTFRGRTVDFRAHELRVGERVLALTLMEANLLRYLIRHAGQAVSRASMLSDVWEVREDTDTRAIDNFIVRLRRYIEDDPASPRHLVTVRGVGYRFLPEP